MPFVNVRSFQLLLSYRKAKCSWEIVQWSPTWVKNWMWRRKDGSWLGFQASRYSTPLYSLPAPVVPPSIYCRRGTICNVAMLLHLSREIHPFLQTAISLDFSLSSRITPPSDNLFPPPYYLTFSHLRLMFLFYNSRTCWKKSMVIKIIIIISRFIGHHRKKEER